MNHTKRSRTSRSNPYKTGHVRPTIPKFYIWQERGIKWPDHYAYRHNLELHPWRWCCTLCDPPSYGCRTQKGAWLAILTISMPRHFFVRGQHHEHVARKRKLCSK